MLSTVAIVPAPERADSPSTPSDTVLRLFDAATAAFADNGFHATTTRDIASRAGLSPAGVYVHFTSKEELLYRLSRAGHEQALALITSAADDVDSPSEALAAVMARFSAWHAEHYAIARVVQNEFPHLSEAHRDEVLALRKRIDATVRRVLRAGEASGDFVLDNVADTALALLSIVVDVARWYTPALHRTPEQIGATNAALGLRLVGCRGPNLSPERLAPLGR
ncbi:MAG: TetR family transcriptional regulator [Actinomycetales bacterium]|nr:TetR family transcriptional regulator [Actinomycetales bacterium]